jgi:release factor glutamine methyltransferase
MLFAGTRNPCILFEAMRIHDLLLKWLPRVKTAWPEPFAYRELRRLIATLLKKTEIWIEAHEETLLSEEETRLLEKAIASFAKGQPVAQIIHAAPFFGAVFFVNQYTLIPRPETTLLVEEAVRLSTRHTLAIDIGTGSGCIAISLATEHPSFSVFASEKSAAALLVAKKNARTLHVNQLRFFLGSLLHPTLKKAITTHPAQHLLFVANLPYLPKTDRKRLSKSVVQFEPETALFAAREGRALIEQLLEQIQRFSLIDQRSFDALFEFDPPQATRLRAYAEQLFPNATVSLKKDENGRSRLLHIHCPSPANV